MEIIAAHKIIKLLPISDPPLTTTWILLLTTHPEQKDKSQLSKIRASTRIAKHQQGKKNYQDDNSDNEDGRDKGKGKIKGKGRDRGRGRGKGRGRGGKTNGKDDDTEKGEEDGIDEDGSDDTDKDKDESSDTSIQDWFRVNRKETCIQYSFIEDIISAYVSSTSNTFDFKSLYT